MIMDSQKMMIALLLFLSSSVILFSQTKSKGEILMQDKMSKYGIEGYQAPELNVPLWIDGEGKEITPVKLEDYKGKFKVIYCFQAWCPGCHSRGLPALQKMVEALKDKEQVAFFAIQTVFEGKHANTLERMLEIQKEYDLSIPFGHDKGNETTRNISSTMYNYRTGGTPWFIFIDQEGGVVFNDFHLNTDKAIEYLKAIK
jgi:thiol-disulfide isomerase/thioredoxin